MDFLAELLRKIKPSRLRGGPYPARQPRSNQTKPRSASGHHDPIKAGGHWRDGRFLVFKLAWCPLDGDADLIPVNQVGGRLDKVGTRRLRRELNAHPPVGVVVNLPNSDARFVGGRTTTQRTDDLVRGL